MIKIKVIDLLNKIANGEEVPKKIKYKDKIYYADVICSTGKYYYYDGIDTLLLEVINIVDQLNDEVEIIEDKKIDTINWKSYGSNLKELNKNIDDLANKINEIIDYINKGE